MSIDNRTTFHKTTAKEQLLTHENIKNTYNSQIRKLIHAVFSIDNELYSTNNKNKAQ